MDNIREPQKKRQVIIDSSDDEVITKTSAKRVRSFLRALKVPF